MKTIIVGLDAFDPQVFESLSSAGKLPALTRLAEEHHYAPFAVSSPPQSEVSWTSIATGLDPAGHGMFDFVHRHPKTYNLYVSLLPMRKTRLGTEFDRPYRGHTIFDEAIERGYPATSLWWPATFPARLDSPVYSIPGLGTPDIYGRLGVGVGFHYGVDTPKEGAKIPLGRLTARGKNSFGGHLVGPARQTKSAPQPAISEFSLDFHDENTALLALGKQRIELTIGQWSPIIEVRFKMGWLISVRAITQVILTQGLPEPRLYFLPLQIHPLHPIWRYASPRGFVRKTWETAGGYLSLGWPQDTTALEEGWIDDDQFLALCEQIFAARRRVMLANLERFREGVLACVFDTLDRVQHMFWQQRPDVIEEWYRRYDSLVGEVQARIAKMAEKPHLLVASDHGFAEFDHKVHLNRWLEERGYLRRKDGEGGKGSLEEVDWEHTTAYAIGLNSLYLNLQGREGQGSVPVQQIGEVMDSLRRDLLAWKSPQGEAVFHRVQPSSEIYSGPFAPFAPDLVLGFNRGFRASADTGLGKWGTDSLEVNRDHWRADHCMDAELVPGVLFSNQGFKGVERPSFRDFPHIAIGMTPKAEAAPPETNLTEEEQSELEERLKGLGYL